VAGNDLAWGLDMDGRAAVVGFGFQALLGSSTVVGTVVGFSTAGDAANGLLFGWDIAEMQKWALIYLGLSSMAFVVVWVVGYFRRAS